MNLNFWEDERKKTLFLIVLLSLGIVVFDGLLVIRPLWNKYSSARRRYLSITRELRNSMKKVKDSDLLLYIAKLKRQISDLDKKVVNEYDLPFIMEKISSLAEECGIITKRISPEESDKRGEVYFSVFSYGGQGTYHNLGKFLSKLEGEDYIARVTMLKIIPNPNDYTKNSIKLTISILTKNT